MFGAVLGDVIGSRFEFDRGGKTTDFELFTEEDCFTDDTVMTVAVADGLIKAGFNASVEEIKESVIRSMMTWGHKYPNAGYGGRFYRWLFSGREPEPYNSYGNGSAMRVSAAGWLYDSLERTREVARATAEVTHNHPEGIKGAECTAAVIYMGICDYSKDSIRKYVEKEFGYDLSESLEELRARHEHVESCMDSMPKALVAFFEGDSYESVVRNAVSLGGDTDTLAAIAGAMAEGMYGMPREIREAGEKFLPEDLKEVLNRAEKKSCCYFDWLRKYIVENRDKVAKGYIEGGGGYHDEIHWIMGVKDHDGKLLIYEDYRDDQDDWDPLNLDFTRLMREMGLKIGKWGEKD